MFSKGELQLDNKLIIQLSLWCSNSCFTFEVKLRHKAPASARSDRQWLLREKARKDTTAMLKLPLRSKLSSLCEWEHWEESRTVEDSCDWCLYTHSKGLWPFFWIAVQSPPLPFQNFCPIKSWSCAQATCGAKSKKRTTCEELLWIISSHF